MFRCLSFGSNSCFLQEAFPDHSRPLGSSQQAPESQAWISRKPRKCIHILTFQGFAIICISLATFPSINCRVKKSVRSSGSRTTFPHSSQSGSPAGNPSVHLPIACEVPTAHMSTARLRQIYPPLSPEPSIPPGAEDMGQTDGVQGHRGRGQRDPMQGEATVSQGDQRLCRGSGTHMHLGDNSS